MSCWNSFDFKGCPLFLINHVFPVILHKLTIHSINFFKPIFNFGDTRICKENDFYVGERVEEVYSKLGSINRKESMINYMLHSEIRFGFQALLFNIRVELNLLNH